MSASLCFILLDGYNFYLGGGGYYTSYPIYVVSCAYACMEAVI
jgi:hypothetical protein